jgi:hypothetical protein
MREKQREKRMEKKSKRKEGGSVLTNGKKRNQSDEARVW